MKHFQFYKSEYIEFVLINDSFIDFSEHCHTDDFVITIIKNGTAVLKKNLLKSIVNTGNNFNVIPYENHTLISESPIDLITMCIKKSAVYHLDITTFQNYIENALLNISKILPIEITVLNLFRNSANIIYNTYYTNISENVEYVHISRDKIEKFPENIETIEKLSAEIYMSKYHYIRRFREISGLTPHKFQIQNRIRKAQKLLINGKNVTDISQIMGFYDQSHFDKYFKKIVGISPTEYVCSFSNFLQAEV